MCVCALCLGVLCGRVDVFFYCVHLSDYVVVVGMCFLCACVCSRVCVRLCVFGCLHLCFCMCLYF